MATPLKYRHHLTIPRPPPLHPTWTTYMWLAFLVAVVVFTSIGLLASVVR
jgi:hypothetical protein